MESPFCNDPMCLLAEAFRRLYNKEYRAQYAPVEMWEQAGEAPYGETWFQEDGSAPVVTIFTQTPLEHLPEIFAHELAHVAVGPGKEHGPEWQQAFEAIHNEYTRIGNEMFGKSEELEE